MQGRRVGGLFLPAFLLGGFGLFKAMFKKAQLEALLADEKTFQHQDTARDVSAQYEQLKRQLDEAYLAWTALAEEHE